MTCREFLERYTEWRDGLILDPRVRAQLHGHRRRCASCAKYDLAVRRGVLALRSASRDMAPPPALQTRLDSGLGTRGSLVAPSDATWNGLAAALLVLSALGVVAVELRERRAEMTAEPQAVVPAPVANRGLPFVTFYNPSVSVQVSAPTPYMGQVHRRPAIHQAVFP